MNKQSIIGKKWMLLIYLYTSMMDSLCYDAMLSRAKGTIKKLSTIKHLTVQRPIGDLVYSPPY